MGRKTNTPGSRPGRPRFNFGFRVSKSKCGKIRYATREDAELILAVARGSNLAGVEGRREQRSYHCPRCDGHHLTSHAH